MIKSKFLNKELDIQWKELISKLNTQFDGDLDITAVLFLIGVQELGKGFQKYKKHEKLEIIHIAICTLLEPYGYYIFKGYDEDSYPHWENVTSLPILHAGEQLQLMKEAVITYFQSNEFI